MRLGELQETASLEREPLRPVWLDLLQECCLLDQIKAERRQGLGLRDGLTLGESISELISYLIFPCHILGKEFCELLCFLKP